MTWDVGFWSILLGVIDVVLATYATTDIVLRKRETRAAIGWVALVWLSPLAGCFVYFCFGINRIERTAISLRLQNRWHHPRRMPLTKREAAEQTEFISQHPELSRLALLVRNLTGMSAAPGNEVRPLEDGDQAFPEMLGAIDGAQRSISLSSYIFDNDAAGKAFLDRLIAAKTRGVQIRILIDDVGSQYSKPSMMRALLEAGLKAETFLPTRVPRLFHYANLRNHRKILVVDGRVGFTGGTNIREGHWLSKNPKHPVRCLHFRFDGPVVRHLQEVFAIDWAFTTDETLDGEDWFPNNEHNGDVWARGIPGGPDEDLDKLPLTILGALSSAQKSVHIVTPYFLPNQALVQALNAAALRGTDVRILLPQESNIALVDWASYALRPYLVERGCRIFLSPPPFDHTKLMVVDGLWSLVGSTNWDPRSLRLNFEFNVECYSDALGQQLVEFTERRISQSRELLLEELRSRSYTLRVRDGLARLFSPYL